MWYGANINPYWGMGARGKVYSRGLVRVKLARG